MFSYIVVAGFQGLHGDCGGGDLRALVRANIQDCAASCKDDPACVGFVYTTEIQPVNDCFLKAQTCPAPSIVYWLELSMYYKETNGKVYFIST